MFTSLEQAKHYQVDHARQLDDLTQECVEVDGVVYAEPWLNGVGPSFVAGFDDGDEMVVCFEIDIPST